MPRASITRGPLHKGEIKFHIQRYSISCSTQMLLTLLDYIAPGSCDSDPDPLPPQLMTGMSKKKVDPPLPSPAECMPIEPP